MGAVEPVAGADPAFAPLRQAAGELGVDAWAVGGFVRDTLLGRPQPDLDVVVAAGRGPELAARFAEITGSRPPVLFPRFGTAQVTWNGRLVEFASARAESYAPDSRKPDVRPATIQEDLLRRDFTVNAMLMDLDGRVSDPLGGRADLERRLLRTPRDPTLTFSDDPLRMLRAVRLAAQLGFTLDAPLLPAMRALRERARPPVLSVERAREELVRMLVSERPVRALELLDEAGLMEVMLPELTACHGVPQGGWHTHDVFGHTLGTVGGTAPDLVLRLAALFHDVGKPATAAADGSFLGHDELGALMAAAALERLRFSGAEAERVARLVRLHLRPVFYESGWSDGAVRRLARAAGPELEALLALARADMAASAYPHAEKLDELERRLHGVLAETPSRMRLTVAGEDVMRARGIGPGPEVGRLLGRLEELVLDGAVAPQRETILDYLDAHPEI